MEVVLGMSRAVWSLENPCVCWAGTRRWSLTAAGEGTGLPSTVVCGALSLGCRDDRSLCLEEVNKQLTGHYSGACHFFLPSVSRREIFCQTQPPVDVRHVFEQGG